MSLWIDVKEHDWFYNEVMEASSIVLEDGRPLIEGIGYRLFKDGAPYIYEEHVAQTGQTEFTLEKKIVPTGSNPLYVYIDGVQTMYKELKQDSGVTTVVLYYPPKAGSVVSFASYGEPVVDKFGKPVSASGTPIHPHKKLDHADTYFYDKFNRRYQEYVYAFGRALRRLDIDESEWEGREEADVVREKIGLKTDVYAVSPSGTVWLPYNLNGVTCEMTYTSLEDGVVRVRGGKFKATSPSVVHNNRFFPQAYITRAEAFVLMDRLRETFYSRFTDMKAPSNELNQTIIAYQGQKVFKLNGNYPAGKGMLEVRVNGVKKTVGKDYQEFDRNTVLFNTPLEEGTEVTFYFKKEISTRFTDVGVDSAYYNQADGTRTPIFGRVENSWWAPHVLAMEEETFSNGEYLINGMEVTMFNNGDVVVDDMNNPVRGSQNPEIRFMPNTLLTRAQAVAFLNRFRKWCIERFK